MNDVGQTQPGANGSQQPADGQSEAYRRGVARRDRIVGRAGTRRRQMLAAVHPDLEKVLLEFAWGTILDRPGLSERDRELITLGVLLALGRDREATTHLHAALNVGISKDELVELLIHCGVYAGFPATMTGAGLLADVLAARGELHIPHETDEPEG
ncbi:MAG: carboxymuconolactone decarboxylase family protein [Chloroflexota bacterium]